MKACALILLLTMLATTLAPGQSVTQGAVTVRFLMRNSSGCVAKVTGPGVDTRVSVPYGDLDYRIPSQRVTLGCPIRVAPTLTVAFDAARTARPRHCRRGGRRD